MGFVTNAFGDLARFYGMTNKQITSFGGLANNQVSNFFRDEIENKSELRGAQLEGLLGGVPYVGDLLRGVEGAVQMEDLYNSTGKVAQYAANQNLGTSAAGHAIGQMANKIADGSHDLYEYYSGSPDEFRSEMNNMYG